MAAKIRKTKIRRMVKGQRAQVHKVKQEAKTAPPVIKPEVQA